MKRNISLSIFIFALINFTGFSQSSPAWTFQDIGAVGVPGSASESSGLVQIQASGQDIWGIQDSFGFRWVTLSGDGQIVAKLDSLNNTNDWAKAGVMIRQSLASNAAYAFAGIAPGAGAFFQRRLTSGGQTLHLSGPMITPPYWLKLVRAGRTLTASISSDGNHWEILGNETITMSATVFAGLAVTSHDNSVLTEAVFEQVSVGPISISGDDSGVTGLNYISDLNWTSATSGMGSVQSDQSAGADGNGSGKSLTLKGGTYAKGLGVKAPSEVIYNLGGKYTSFISDIGLDDDGGSTGAVDFQVWADGVKRYDSGIMKSSSLPRRLTLPVTGKQQLRLVVTDASNGGAPNEADWAGARLLSTWVENLALSAPSRNGNSIATAVAVDRFGNLFITGSFQGTMSLPSGTTTITLTSGGDADAFVVKFSPKGQILWAQSWGGGGFDQGQGIVADSTGNVFVTGQFSSMSAGFGGQGAVNTKGNMDTFVLKLDGKTGSPIAAFGNGGVVTWGGQQDDIGYGITTNSTGDIFVAGGFVSTNAGFNSTGTTASSGMDDVFIFKLKGSSGLPDLTFNGTGVVTWGGSDHDHVHHVVVDSYGSVLVSGHFSSNDAGFNGFGSYATTAAHDIMILKVNSKGQPDPKFGKGGVVTWGGQDVDHSHVLALDNKGSLYVAGHFTSVDAGFNGTGTSASQGGDDVVVLKINETTGAPVTTFGNNGAVDWGGSGAEYPDGIVVSKDGSVYVAGNSDSSNAGFDGPGSFTSNGGTDGFVLRLNAATGQPVSSFGNNGVLQIGGSDTDAAVGVTVDSSGNLYICGEFQGMVPINTGTQTINLFGSPFFQSAFLLKLGVGGF